MPRLSPILRFRESVSVGLEYIHTMSYLFILYCSFVRSHAKIYSTLRMIYIQVSHVPKYITYYIFGRNIFYLFISGKIYNVVNNDVNISSDLGDF